MINKSAVNTFSLVLIYAFSFFFIQFFLHKIGMVSATPNHYNLLYWDSGWYQSIVVNGYQYSSGPSNSGFYILLPWLWGILHLNAWEVCILNIVLFATGFTILSSLIRPSTVDKIIWLSIPCVYFAFIPYTESLFFLLSSACLYGIIKEKKIIIWVSLFFLSLTRATVIFLLPAFLIMELLTNDRRHLLKSIYRYIVYYFLPLVIGTLVFILYQYWKTRIWFAYFRQQSIYWERKFNIPTLPFHSMEGERTIWLSAIAMFACLIAIIMLFQIAKNWLLKNKIYHNKLLALSLAYLMMALIVVICFNPTWGTYTTNVMGMFRYSLITPFFFIFLYHITNNVQYKTRDFIIIAIIANIVWLTFGSYVHVKYFIFFNVNTAIIFLYMLYANKKLTWPALIIVAINVLLQINLFQQFIKQLYPD
ncbi:MAG TPA: hypothetical protein VN721_15105 [Flavipsychrobacter sp.]|nr:hypothetical protein [Flavipsychrobacter sp.]